MALAGKGPLRLEHFPEWLRSASEPRMKMEGASDSPPPPDPAEKSEEIRKHLISLLTAHQGNLSAVARAWGKERMQIHRWMRKFGLQARDYRRG